MLTGSRAILPNRTAPGNPIEITSNDQSAVISRTASTIPEADMVGPLGVLRISSLLLRRTLTFDPPTSIARTTGGAPSVFAFIVCTLDMPMAPAHRP
jgi:hypothetical protein